MSFARNAATVATATLVSRILGFARDILIAAALGAGPAADAFVVAFRLPSLMRRLFAEGAFNSAFVPLHAEADARGAAQRFAGDIFSVIATAFLGLTIIALLAMPLVIRLIAPGFAASGGEIELATHLSRIAFPYCFLTALMVVASALLNARGRFIASAYAPVLVNIAMIGAILAAPHLGWLGKAATAEALCWSVLFGGLLQYVLVFTALRHTGFGLRLAMPHLTQPVRRFFRLALPGIAAAGITQVNAFVGLVIASPAPGAVAWLYYADRVYQVPLGVVSVAIGIALLPDLARHVAVADREGEAAALGRACEFAAFLSLPAALALAIAARPIVAVLFEHGAFSAADGAATALALVAFAFGLPAFVAAKILQPMFFARIDTRTPMLVAMAGVALDVALSITLFPHFRQVGIAAAAAASGWANVLLLGLIAWRRGHVRLDDAARRRLPRIALAALVMAAALLVGVPFAEQWTSANSAVWQKLAALAALCGGGLALFVGAAAATGGVEIAGLRRAFRKGG